MDNNLLLSIIIPVYNVENYLRECLDSIFNEPDTGHKIEVIAVDDGSTDCSHAILDEYAARHGNMRVITQENRGLGGARNSGIDAAEGIYIMFLDSDDFLVERCLVKLLDYAANSEADVIKFDYLEYDEGRKITPVHRIHTPRHGEGKKIFVEWSKTGAAHPAVWNRIYRTAMLKDNLLYFKPGVYYEDVVWSPRTYYHAGSVEYLPLTLYSYRINRDGSIMATQGAKHCSDIMGTLDELVTLKNSLKHKEFETALGNYASGVLRFHFNWIYEGEFCEEYSAGLIARSHLLKYSAGKSARLLYLLSFVLPKKWLFISYDKIRRARSGKIMRKTNGER